MSKDTDLESKIPSRISVCFNGKTDKYIIKQDGDKFRLEKNRLVIKGRHTPRDILGIIEASFGYAPPSRPDLREKDCVRVR